jgi:hypothetical protein
MADKKIDFDHSNEGISQKNHPDRETRSQQDKERHPDYFRKELEKAGYSEWSGKSWGGRGR